MASFWDLEVWLSKEPDEVQKIFDHVINEAKEMNT